MTDTRATVLSFRGDPHESSLSRASGHDVHGPLSCGCFRVAVLDFGHGETCSAPTPSGGTAPTPQET